MDIEGELTNLTNALNDIRRVSVLAYKSTRSKAEKKLAKIIVSMCDNAAEDNGKLVFNAIKALVKEGGVS